MSVYTVHEPPLRAAETAPDPERFIFVRDGFYFWAFVFSVLWMLWHRMWLVLLIYVAVVVGLEAALRYVGRFQRRTRTDRRADRAVGWHRGGDPAAL